MSAGAAAGSRETSPRAHRLPAAIRPSHSQELLLRASLADADTARAAWRDWQASAREELDADSAGLLPLLHRNLCRLGVDHPALEPLARIHRRVRETNERRLSEAAEALHGLRRAGLSVLLLKGACLLPHYYRDLGARPLGDVDVAVARADAAKAIDALREAGFRPNKPLSAATLRYRHSANFSNDTGTSLDLHWHVLAESRRHAGDDAFWQASIPGALLDVPVRLPDPGDLLLAVLAHGVKGGTAPGLHWIPDAVTLLAAARDRIDWQRFEDQAIRHRVILRVRAGLHHLASRLHAQIPAEVLADLDRLPVSGTERVESRLGRPGLAIPRVLLEYWRLQQDSGLRGGLGELPAYLRFRFRRFRQSLAPKESAGSP